MLIVARDNQRTAGAGGNGKQQIADSLAAFEIQAGGRFVSNDDAGAAQQCPAMATRCISPATWSRYAAGALEADGRKQGFRTLYKLCIRDTRQAGGQQDVIQRRETGKKMKLLHDKADIGSPPMVATALGQLGNVPVPQTTRPVLTRSRPAMMLMRVLFPSRNHPSVPRGFR